ncbi:WXG100 family type VII secretion target [Chloroflexi bacterium TSY]|nr:WXG100 family type VII secretion target [Chloroflexi bacterium TSY]
MADEIRVVYESMDEMSQTFRMGVEQLQDTMQEMQVIANTMEEGALLGRGGEAFTDAIRTKLARSLTKLTEKFEELDKDVQDAKKFAQEADKRSKGMF